MLYVGWDVIGHRSLVIGHRYSKSTFGANNSVHMRVEELPRDQLKRTTCICICALLFVHYCICICFCTLLQCTRLSMYLFCTLRLAPAVMERPAFDSDPFALQTMTTVTTIDHWTSPYIHYIPYSIMTIVLILSRYTVHTISTTILVGAFII